MTLSIALGRIRGFTVLASSCLVVLGVALPARASSSYPAAIESQWRVGSLPVSGDGCRLCHQSELGGVGTATTPFGKTLRSLGLSGGSQTSLLRSALVQDQAQALDSDGDGFSDYSEVALDHTNPNDRGDHRSEPTPPPQGGTDASGGAENAGGTQSSGGEFAASEGGAPPAPEACTPSQTIYPELSYGCAWAAQGGGVGSALSVFATLSALGLLRRRARTNAPSGRPHSRRR